MRRRDQTTRMIIIDNIDEDGYGKDDLQANIHSVDTLIEDLMVMQLDIKR